MKQPNYLYKGIITNVVDGDTLDISIDLGFCVQTIQRIRLAGINTEELSSKDPSLKDLATKAKDWLSASVGSECIVKSYKTDKYGRYLADVYIGQSHLNNALLEHGLAKPYLK